jgi:ribosomal protein S18 acetylase RimI-like enzyme/sugar phosphate isomerase/epimerase
MVAIVPHRLGRHELPLLRGFLDGAGSALETFRYFAQRPLEAVNYHVCTWLILVEGTAVAYGHLDPDGDTVWLGLAVQETHQGRGYGRAMMRLLLDAARGAGVLQLTLSVDDTNARAIRLYESFGFHVHERSDRLLILKCDVRSFDRAAVSTLAFAGRPVETMIDISREHGFPLEFSSGLPHRPDMEALFLAQKGRCLAHNYFPAPAVPFVLNLASRDAALRQRSVDHCVAGIRLSYAAGAPFFSAHAGFCVDPAPDDLGRRFATAGRLDPTASWSVFVDSVREVLLRTAQYPTGFLVENNVLTAANQHPAQPRLVLGVEASELCRLVRDVDDPRLGILCDTGHLKISAATLGKDHFEQALEMLPHTRCFHHSENDSRTDCNFPFGDDYWGAELARHAPGSVHVLEVRTDEWKELLRMGQLLEHFAL